jgi:VWFA-related protein
MSGRYVAASVLVSAALSVHTAARQTSQPTEPPRFKVAVDAVRIDAVVTDRTGQIVRDLTADDFEIFQDGKRQNVTFAQFVPVLTQAPAEAPRSPDPMPTLPVQTPRLMSARASIQRTLAIVIDDLGLSVESVFAVKRGLRTFVERNVMPTDLVGILRTGGSGGPLQPFTTDPRAIASMIDDLRWNGRSRNGVEPFVAVNRFTTFDPRTNLDLDDFKSVEALRVSSSAVGTLGALNLVIHAARDLPGRKSLLFISEGFSLFDEERRIDMRVRAALDRLIDQATRAGVVIYSLDARGLQTAGLQASDNLKSAPNSQAFDDAVRGEAANRSRSNQDTQDALAYVAEQTGGFAVMNTSDLGKGLARISNDIRDYYVIGYVPAQGTFVDKGKKPSYHKITVRVRRPGLRVRTRKEFLGVSDVDEPAAPTTPREQLIRAAISPFVTTDIALRVTTVPAYTSEEGLLVRTQLHIDARGLTFAASENDKKTASADVLGLVFDRDGTEVAHVSTGFSVALSDTATEEALRHGLLYTFRVEIPRAGAYQMRFAVRDRASGSVGSAGEFVELNDIARGVFAVSGIILGSNAAEFTRNTDETVVSAAQALREYSPGSPLVYAYEVYNPGEQVRITSSIWRGAQQVVVLPTETLTAPAASTRRFGAAGHLKLGDALPRGGYVLQVTAVTSGTAKNRVRTAVQRTPFEVR